MFFLTICRKTARVIARDEFQTAVPQTITIPRTLTGGEELVVIPRKLYERFVRGFQRGKPQTKLDRDLDAAIAEYRSGDSFGPFDSADAAIGFLREHRKSTRKP